MIRETIHMEVTVTSIHGYVIHWLFFPTLLYFLLPLVLPVFAHFPWSSHGQWDTCVLSWECLPREAHTGLLDSAHCFIGWLRGRLPQSLSLWLHIVPENPCCHGCCGLQAVGREHHIATVTLQAVTFQGPSDLWPLCHGGPSEWDYLGL